MKKYTLKRTGDSDLIFTGELLGSATGKPMGCQERLKWIEVDIYKTEGGTYIVSVLNQALWQDEGKVFVCEEPKDILEALDIYNVSAGKENLVRAAKQALEEAAGKDEGLKRVFTN